ncbi:hypothetical protein ERO13_D05G310800v2 [Gossypium hirsutum]|uniref:HMA domain-containing protein n=3 Tax=Gossypium TaxID=3633 RepID=A0A5D2L3Q8_GOSTO|nr:hypothetical protein ERO13_D05G310800v2 [Gossypium hirsutum]TYG70889.1 hypothetical protein ES288_D05G350700v1 [Gossypium darwinii]TYH73734.1 hypothetical protein ES332_D05G349700v1 [Gossypium tomentosum]
MGNKEQIVEEEIVLKIYMHCEGCVSKVINCLTGFEGIEEVKADMKSNRVVVKGQKADPLKVLERVKKKYSTNVELISPKPKIVPNDHKVQELPKKQEIIIEVVSLKMNIHCEGCANDIKKSIEKMKGILNVEADMKKSMVTITGSLGASNIAETIRRRLGKHVEIVAVESKDKKKNHDKGNEKSNKKGEEEKIVVLNYPPQYSAQNICPNQIFSNQNIFSCSIM